MTNLCILNNKLCYKKIITYKKLSRMCYCTVLPSSETMVIKSKPVKNNNNLQNINNKEFRVNEVNVQMISNNIYNQLFKSKKSTLDPKIVQSCREHLHHHGIDYKHCTVLPDVELKLPKLEGDNIVEHFWNIGEAQSAPYRELLNKLALIEVPALPKNWQKISGWHKYVPNKKPEPVPCPTDDALILDVEVLMTAGKRPTLACALSPEAWYGWVSEPLANGDEHQSFNDINYEDLIPLETDGVAPHGNLERPRVVVGHNVSFDRAKVKEQYWMEQTGLRFMDTMSMHTCVSGVTSYQRAILNTKDKGNHDDDQWMDISSLNGLSDVHKLYCGTPIDKETRDIFMEGKMEDVHKNFQKLMTYCANDVVATLNVLKHLLPMFLERFPHPVTLAGMLELGSAYLPVNSNWTQYIESAEATFEDMKLESRQLLSLKADETCRLLIDGAYKTDLWMWDQDWSIQEFKLNKEKAVKKSKKGTLIDNIEVKEDIEEENIDKNTNDNLVNNNYLNEEYIQSLNEHKPNNIKEENIKVLKKKFDYLYKTGQRLPVRRSYLAGYPAWYRKLCTKPGKDDDWVPGANNITTSMQITPKLLRLTWEGYPLHHIPSQGWGFVVPFSHNRPETYEPIEEEPQLPLKELLAKCPVVDKGRTENEFGDSMLYNLSNKVEADMGRKTYYARKKLDEKASANQYHGTGVWCGVELQGCCHFLRLPHKDGPKNKVGNPLAKDFLDMFSQNVLAAQGNDAEKVLNLGRMMSYWRNNRNRIMGQQVVWLPDACLPKHLQGQTRQYGAITPQVVVCGTLTRRASEPTWMTASNAREDRIGSELRAMVQAPPGYKFVGADVDSQELWLAALLGDSKSGLAGGTALGRSVLAGTRETNTDLHSVTARAAGVSRDHAKVITYARMYGAGQNFAERLLKQYNPTMTNSEAKNKAAKMYSTTKGRRVYRLKKKYMEGFMEEDLSEQEVEMTSYQATRMARLSNKDLDEVFERPTWVGGTESDMFNKLEEIAASPSPSTAFLSGRLSRALENTGGRFSNTTLNWAVQSGAADFLHLMLVCMRWRAPKSARFCLSFHDEVRYLVPDKDRYETALALQITNLFTRAFCSQRVGINDLPLSVAFFSSIEIDQVLRKDCNMCCTTPSNPHGLEKGYGIENGESLNIFHVLEKCDMVNK